MLLAAIDETHKGTYDFLYLPIDFKVMTVAMHLTVSFIKYYHFLHSKTYIGHILCRINAMWAMHS